MTEASNAASRVDRLFLIAFVPAAIYFVVSLYVRMTSDTDPLWAEIATPLCLALLGARAIVRPTSPETQKINRAVGMLLVGCSALLLLLIILNHSG